MITTRIVAVASQAIARSMGYDVWKKVTGQFIIGLGRLGDKRQATPIIQLLRDGWSALPDSPARWDWEALRANLVSAQRLLSKYDNNDADADLIAKMVVPVGVMSGEVRITGMSEWLKDYITSVDEVIDVISKLPECPPTDVDLEEAF